MAKRPIDSRIIVAKRPPFRHHDVTAQDTKREAKTTLRTQVLTSGSRMPCGGVKEESSRERMEKYKEERRRQMRLKQKSSSDDSPNSEESPSYMRYAKTGRKVSPSPQRGAASPPRSNKAARLRAARVTHQEEVSRRPPDYNQNHSTVLSNAAFSSDSTASQDGLDADNRKKEKDKSGKRKSNLNRSIHEESTDDANRRRLVEDTPLRDSPDSDHAVTRQPRIDSSSYERSSTVDYINSRKKATNPRKTSSEPERDLRSGLRRTTDSMPSFLRKGQNKTEDTAEWLQQLKTRRQVEDSSSSDDAVSFDGRLRRKSFGDDERCPSPERSSSSDASSRRKSVGDEAPRGIMKKHSCSSVQVKPILKKRCSSEELECAEPKPILKKKHSTDDDKPRPILKDSPPKDEMPKSILKRKVEPIPKKSYGQVQSFEELFAASTPAAESAFEDIFASELETDASPAKTKSIDKMDEELLSVPRSRTTVDSEEGDIKEDEAEAATAPVSVLDRIKTLQSKVEEQQPRVKRSNSNSNLKPSRRTADRYKTQPVTVSEKQRATSPQNSRESLVKKYFHEEAPHPQHIQPEKKVVEATNYPVKSSSSQSTTINIEEVEPTSEEEKEASISVQDRAKMFLEKQQNLILPRTSSVVRRPVNRVRQERSKTQPVSIADIHAASEKVKQGTPNRDGEEPSKLSLLDRVKLFSPDEKEEPRKREPPKRRRVIRRSSPARFRTQPVTTEEIKKISPLAKLEPSQESAATLQSERTPPDGAPSAHKGILKSEERTSMHDDQHRGSEDKIRKANEELKQRSRHESSSSSEELFVPPEKNLALALASISEQAREAGDVSMSKKKRSDHLRKQQEQQELFEKPPVMKSASIICTEKCSKSLQSVLQADMKLNGIQESKTTVTNECLSGGNLKDRVAMLSHHGETAWKERLPKLKSDEGTHTKSKRRTRDERPSSLKDRINLLEVAQEGWKNRVEDKDAKNFTVEGKLEKLGKTVLPSSSPSPDRQVPKLIRFRSKTGPELPLDASVKVQVPKADDESFSSFFQSAKESTTTVDIHSADLDDIFPSHDMLAGKRSVKVARRTMGSRNPLKVLAARTDLQQEYSQVSTGFAQKEFKRMNVEKISANASLALEALAGLASKEDFKSVSLKKTEEFSPEQKVKLIQIKGRRHTQTRLVEPVAASINSGDTYILVTPTEVFTYIGEFSNVIEKSRAAELAKIITTKKELSCSAKTVQNIDQEKRTTGSHVSKFWKILKAPDSREASAPGTPEEDEFYEQSVMQTNLAWEVVGQELVPVEECWGAIPKYSILEENKVFVFDFGAEMFVWHGKKASMDARGTGRRLAQELWGQGYDYSDCAFNPLNGAPHRQPSPYPMKGNERPSWASLFLRQNQHMENILFRDKFLDWPDMSRVIRVRDNKDKDSSGDFQDLQPCEMIEEEESKPDLHLEGANLSRGEKYYDEKEKRMYEITSVSVCMWHIQEFGSCKLPTSSMGQIYSGDAYVFRWKYHIKQKGRTLTGKESRHTQTGRERCAYFFWQGRDCSISEKGTSALMTVELDQEMGPQIRVPQGREPPAFLNLFGGGLVIYDGKRGDEVERGEWRLFACRGSRSNEAFLMEVPVKSTSLRSRASFLLVSLASNKVIIWHGTRSPRQVAAHCAEQLRTSHPLEMEFQSTDPIEISEELEGEESMAFKKVFGKVEVHKTGEAEPNKMWELSSWTGSFQATPVLCSYRDEQFPVQFPFYQADLYAATPQPALFFLDCGKELWIWQGWWPEDNDNTGSGRLRWAQERRAAISTAFSYAQQKYPKDPPDVWLVWAGLEPVSFTNHFLEWDEHPEIAILNKGEGHAVEGAKVNAEIVFQELSKTHFSLEELQGRPLPEGVHPLKLEQYLTDEHFKTVMEMDKEEFYKHPAWKQTQLKQAVGLF